MNMPSSVLPGDRRSTVGHHRHALADGLHRAVGLPTGIAAAIYLEEYGDPTRWYNRLIEVNILNLAAVPSIVFGILGLAFISRGLGFGPTVLTGSITLALLVLPVVVIASREAIRAVPQSIRAGSLALGATQWQTIWRQVLPAAIPGIATGASWRSPGPSVRPRRCSCSASAFVRFNPDGLMSSLHRPPGPDLQLDHRGQARSTPPWRQRPAWCCWSSCWP